MSIHCVACCAQCAASLPPPPHTHILYTRTRTPPPLQEGRVWDRVVDTSLPPPEEALLEGGQPVVSGRYLLAPKAVVVLVAAAAAP